MRRKDICQELQRLRTRIYEGDESQIWVWVIPEKLAVAQRPLRDSKKFGGGPGRRPPPLPPEALPAVEAWVDRLVGAGFRSVISLLAEGQDQHHYGRLGLDYGRLGLDGNSLLGYYRARGIAVESVECTDYEEPPGLKKNQALQAFLRLPKPVLLHCSAGIDRTSPVAAFLSENSK
jgi:hypothetical protein